MKITVTGGSGYIGSRLVSFLRKEGYDVLSWSREMGDLTSLYAARAACEGAEMVFHLAADVGGIGYVSQNKTKCLLDSIITMNLLHAAAQTESVHRFFYASSSCVYPAEKNFPLVENDAYPAFPNTEYGWSKLFCERLCAAFSEEHNLHTTVARIHGVYGPGDVREEGRDHVISALTKQVVAAKLSGDHKITIWGDGSQTRSFLYIDDCVEGIWRLASTGVRGPVNLANETPVSVNEIVSTLEEIACVKLTRFYSKDAATGCLHKVSDNTLLRKSLHWEPPTGLREGLEDIYRDFYDRAIHSS